MSRPLRCVWHEIHVPGYLPWVAVVCVANLVSLAIISPCIRGRAHVDADCTPHPPTCVGAEETDMSPRGFPDDHSESCVPAGPETVSG